MSKSFEIKSLVQEYVGVSAAVALVAVVAFGAAGVAAGIAFPKFEAKAFLEFPDKRLTKASPGLAPNNSIELPLFKRVEASYDSPDQLKGWLQANDLLNSAAGQRLLKQAESPKFWSSVVAPVLPFSKQDQKLYGEIKDAASTQLIGLQLATDARTEALAAEMVGVMARYFTSAVLRERVRAWVVEGRVEAQGTAQALRADIVKAELEISMAERRALDMKAIVARHPEAARMDSRQVVSVNEAEGGERYLSPVAQMVGAEARASQLREDIRRLERNIQQRELLASFYAEATQLVDATPNISRLLPALNALSERHFSAVDGKQEWVKEAHFRVSGALDNLEAMRNQFGVRNGVAVAEAASRDPVRLGALGLALGLGLLGGIAFLRVGLRSMREGDGVDTEPNHPRNT